MEQAISILGTKTLSQWAVKKRLHQSYRNCRVLENRVRILQTEKQHRLKTIQQTLKCHNREVGLRIHKSNRRRQLDNRHLLAEMNRTDHSSFNHSMRENINGNIQSMRESLINQRRKNFEETKIKQFQHERISQQLKIKDINSKQEKRNRVRLMEIESKENIANFWVRKMRTFEKSRDNSIKQKINQQKKNLINMMKLEGSEASLLQEISNTSQMEDQLHSLIFEERSLNGDQLTNLYDKK